jgi:RNA polymerase-binding transcription factor
MAAGGEREVNMNTDTYKRRLLEEETRLVGRMARAGAEAREPADDVRDPGDASTDDVRKDENFAAADADWNRLEEVRAALQRIKDGTFGRCTVDGGPIDEERLKALPWTPMCSRHAHLSEAAAPPRTPSL